MFADKNKASYREERYAFITTIVSLLDFTEPNPGLGIGNTEKSLTTKVLGVPSILPTSLNYVNIKNKNKKENKKLLLLLCCGGCHIPHQNTARPGSQRATAQVLDLWHGHVRPRQISRFLTSAWPNLGCAGPGE